MPDIIDEMVDQGLLVIKTAPRQKKHRFHADELEPRVDAHRHPNGGGWIANTAKVATSVYVAANSEVFGHAEINGHTIIRGRCRVFGNARIDGDITLLGDVVVKDNARIYGRATITGRIDLKNNVCVYGTSGIRGEVVLSGSSVINESIVAGWGTVCGRAHISSSVCEGDFCVCDHAAINASTVRGRFFIGGTTTICASRIINAIPLNGNYSKFRRKKLHKTNVPPPTIELNSAVLTCDSNNMSDAVDTNLRYSNILRGRTTIVASDLHVPLHCACNIGLNKVTINGPRTAIVITRSITIADGYHMSADIRNTLVNSSASNIRAQNASAGAASNAAAAPVVAAPNNGAIAVFDPRGSRIIRV